MNELYLEYLVLKSLCDEKRNSIHGWDGYNLYKILIRKDQLEKEILKSYVNDPNSKEY